MSVLHLFSLLPASKLDDNPRELFTLEGELPLEGKFLFVGLTALTLTLSKGF